MKSWHKPMIARIEAELLDLKNDLSVLRDLPRTVSTGLRLAGLRHEIDMKDTRLCFAKIFVKK